MKQKRKTELIKLNTRSVCSESICFFVLGTTPSAQMRARQEDISKTKIDAQSTELSNNRVTVGQRTNVDLTQ